MKDLLSHIVTSITGAKIDVAEDASDGVINFTLSVPKEQIGIVIGRGGNTINAIKNVLKIRAIKEDVRIDIQVTEA